MSTTISLNGKSRILEKPLTVSEALANWGYVPEKVAVAINETFVPRSAYPQRTIRPGDRVDVLVAVQGG